MSKSRPERVIINGRRIPVDNEIRFLGLKLKRTGFVNHITERIRLAKIQTNKLKRFIHLKTKTKLHLYKALVRPLLEYPVIPISLASNTQMLKLQRVQNRNIKIITKYDEQYDNLTMEELHHRLDLETINTRLNIRLMKLWNKMELKENELYEASMQANYGLFLDHSWWPRVATKYQQDIPDPIYV